MSSNNGLKVYEWTDRDCNVRVEQVLCDECADSAIKFYYDMWLEPRIDEQVHDNDTCEDCGDDATR